MNALYPKGREGILDHTIDMTADIRAMLVKDGYAYSVSHETIADMGSVDNGRSIMLQNKTYENGVFDAADIIIVALAAAKTSALIIYQNTGDDNTARLVAFLDIPPCTPAKGQSVRIKWSTADKIFTL